MPRACRLASAAGTSCACHPCPPARSAQPWLGEGHTRSPAGTWIPQLKAGRAAGWRKLGAGAAVGAGCQLIPGTCPRNLLRGRSKPGLRPPLFRACMLAMAHSLSGLAATAARDLQDCSAYLLFAEDGEVLASSFQVWVGAWGGARAPARAPADVGTPPAWPVMRPPLPPRICVAACPAAGSRRAASLGGHPGRPGCRHQARHDHPGHQVGGQAASPLACRA
jgi:hypothetical protein